MKDLSIIIVSYNTKELTKRCLESLFTQLKNQTLSYEVIVSDNNSSDGSVEMVVDFQKENKNIKLIKNKDNLGFSKGNNVGVAVAEGRYVLFLNSDVIVENIDFDKIIVWMDKNAHVGVMTVRVNLPAGVIDPASHRGFPTLWRSFCYFAGLERMFGKVPLVNRMIGGYHLTWLKLSAVHDIDSPSGAFFLTRRDLLTKLNGFDEDYFMYGEDIDLAYRIRHMGFAVIYNPQYTVTHLKYSSGLKKGAEHQKIKDHFYNAMKIFYLKHYAPKYPKLINKTTDFFINLRKNIS